jgi:hypothetical protein
MVASVQMASASKKRSIDAYGRDCNLTSSSALVRLMHVHMCNAWFGYLVTVLRLLRLLPGRFWIGLLTQM